MAKKTAIITLAQAEKFFNKQLRYIKRATKGLEKAEKFIIRTLNKEEATYFMDWYFSEKNIDVSIRLKLENPSEDTMSVIEERMSMYNCEILHLKMGKFVVKYQEPSKEQKEAA